MKAQNCLRKGIAFLCGVVLAAGLMACNAGMTALDESLSTPVKSLAATTSTVATTYSYTLESSDTVSSGNAVFFTGTFTEGKTWTTAVRGTYSSSTGKWTCSVTSSTTSFEWKCLTGSYSLGETATITAGGLSWDSGSNKSQSDATFVSQTDDTSSTTSSIILHVYNYQYIWYWATGKSGTGAAMTQEGSTSWYAYTLSNTSTINLLFKTASDWSGSKTGDLSISAAGEYWYKDGKFYTENPDPSPTPVSGSIIVHAYNYQYIWYWATGKSGTGAAMTQEGSTSWYSYTLSNTTTINLLFKTASDWSGSKTGDLSISAAGEYWYKNGTFTTENPDDTTAPVLVSFTASQTGTVTGSVVFAVSATDNVALSKAVLTLDGSTTIETVSLSGTSATGTYTWDSSSVKNGSHTMSVVVYDAASLASGSSSITLTTSNENKKPVAIISGAMQVTPGSTKTYSASSSYDTDGGIASYEWSVSGATISGSATASTVNISFPSIAGYATISLCVTDNENASSGVVSSTITISDKTEDFRDETIYFVITTRFYDGYSGNNRYCWDGPAANKTNNDPEWRGDFEGLIQKLDYIKALGFSAVWVTPPVENASGYDYHGYHALNFKKIDDRYATNLYTAKESYQRLIDACHAKGMKIIQDIVLNHTGNWGEENLFPMFTKGTDNGTTSPTMVEGGSKATALETAAKTYGSAYASLAAGNQYNARISAMKEDSNDTDNIYHHCKSLSWNGIECQLGQIAGDCVDLNTENPAVDQYLIDAYDQYIDMGVDSFRVDTVKHINRLMFNKYFNNAFKARGGDDFYVFGEVCARYRGEWNEGVPSLSPSFYTWKETNSYSTGTLELNTAAVKQNFADYASSFTAPISSSSANYLLVNNTYRTPDWTLRSGMDVIDFPMHWAFNNVNDAFGTALAYDKDYSDPSWNVVYVDSHDYAPDCAPENQRFAGYWPDKLDLMFTFRGIPCIFYGSEIEFQKGKVIDNGTNTALADTGRAYYGANLEGTVNATDFGEYTASGTVATTLSNSLAQHIIRLNKIRRAIPALQKGQYTTDGCSGSVAFKRRYTDDSVDSFALVTINGQATFSNIPAGTYIEVITGKTVTVGNGGSITTDSIGSGNMRVYVLKTSSCEVTGKIGSSGTYLN